MDQFSNMMKIRQIAQIVPGAPKNLCTDKKGKFTRKCLLLKGSNVSQEGNISLEKMESALLSGGQRSERYILQENDVIVMARGTAMRVGLVTKEISKSVVVATANFIIIRPDKTKINGEVIFAFLRTNIGVKLIKSLNTGAVIQHIPASTLRDTKVPVPPKEQQSKITNLLSMAQKARQDAFELIEHQKRVVDATILELMV